jgi:hypothetical protein
MHCLSARLRPRLRPVAADVVAAQAAAVAEVAPAEVRVPQLEQPARLVAGGVRPRPARPLPVM